MATAAGLFVDEDRFDDLGPDAIGVLDESAGGFGKDMWRGTDREMAVRLIGALPLHTPSRELRDLLLRLLLTTATPPESRSQGDSGEFDLLALRAERLFAMGEVAALRDLVNAVPPEIQGEALAKLQVQSSLLSYDNAGACANITGHIRQYRDVFWQKVMIFCQALAGRPERAILGLSLLRELGADQDETFFLLADALTGGQRAAVESPGEPTPLHFAMMRAARHQISAEALSSASPAVFRTVASSPNAPLNLRLEAAEGAESAGVFPAESLAQIYASVPFTEDELANALLQTEGEQGPRERALLYRAALSQLVPAARAEVLHRIFKRSRAPGAYARAVRVHLPMLTELKPAPELAWFAADAGRALYSAGRYEAALAWFELAREEAVRTTDAAKAALALWPLVRLVTPTANMPWDQELFEAWRQTVEGESTGAAGRRAQLLLTLFTASGDRVDERAWAGLLGEPAADTYAMPPPAVLHALRTAANAGRVGEVVLLSMVALGEAGLERSHPIVLAEVVTALRAIGLEAGAQRLALEAAISGGV